MVAPQQGDLIKINFDPTKGHEQQGFRPALVVSADLFNLHTGFCWAIPITSADKSLPAVCQLPENLAVHGTLLLAQLRALDWRARPFQRVDTVSRTFMENINARLKAVLEIA